MSGQQFVQSCGIGDVAAHRPDLVEARGHGDDAEARDRTVGRLHADGASERCGLADGSAGVGAHGQRGLETGEGCGRTTRGTAGHVLEVPRVAGVAEGRVLGRRSHREFVEVGLAEHRQTSGLDLVVHGRLVGRNPVLEHLRSRSGGHTFGDDEVLQRHRDACQGVEVLTGGALGVDGLRGLQGEFVGDGDEGVEVILGGGDAVEVGLRDFDGGELTGFQSCGEFEGALVRQFGHLIPPRGSAGRGTCRPRRPGPRPVPVRWSASRPRRRGA